MVYVSTGFQYVVNHIFAGKSFVVNLLRKLMDLNLILFGIVGMLVHTFTETQESRNVTTGMIVVIEKRCHSHSIVRISGNN